MDERLRPHDSGPRPPGVVVVFPIFPKGFGFFPWRAATAVVNAHQGFYFRVQPGLTAAQISLL